MSDKKSREIEIFLYKFVKLKYSLEIFVKIVFSPPKKINCVLSQSFETLLKVFLCKEF